MRRVSLLALGLLMISGVSLMAQEDRVGWMTDYAKAAETAARERKLLLLHFYSDDCAPCKRLEANVFPRPEFAAAIHAAYVPVKVNVERSPELARKYQIVRMPTDVVVTSNWLEVHRAVPDQDPEKYVAMLNATAARSGSALASKPSPAQAAKPVAHQQPVERSSEFEAPMANMDLKQNPAAPIPQSQPGMSSNGRPQANPYIPMTADASGSATKPAAPDRYAAAKPGSQYDSEFSPSEAPLPAPPQFGAEDKTKVSPPGVAAAPAGPAKSPSSAPAAPAVKKAVPVGMDGYCVITLAEKHVWTKGDKRWGAIHRGRLYLFASADAQKTFLADPDRFSPALSGCDPVVFQETGKLVDGHRAHGLTYNGQMYLFADEAALNKFQQTPAPFAETVYQALLKSDAAASKLR